MKEKKIKFRVIGIYRQTPMLGHGQGPTAGAASEVSQEPHGRAAHGGVPGTLTLCIFRVMYWQRAFRAYVI